LIIKRPAEADEIAKAAMYLMTNSYSTGNTLFVDGGLTLN
jgi:enoyl-[acyl-carrier-protein] reductase (NADH)